MKDLSLKEKQKHNEDLKEYIGKINHFFLKSKTIIDNDGQEIKSLFNLFNIKLVQAGYGVLVKDSFIYFDYPYTETVEQFNFDLANHDKIREVDVFIHKNFHASNSNGAEDGFIYFKYNLDKNRETYFLYECINNIGIAVDEIKLQKFLPIMDCAVTNENTYLYDIEISDSSENYKELLILSKKLGLDNEYSYDDNTLICAFELNLFNSQKLKDLAYNLYKEVFFSLEKYFHSPILNKLISEHRKPYILGYKHNLSQLNPINCISVLKAALINNDKILADKKIQELEYILNIHAFTHHIMFDYEFVTAGYTYYDVKFRKKNIHQILLEFNSELNNTKKQITLDFPSHYIPIFDIENDIYEIFDIILILWNLWLNSLRHSTNDLIKISGNHNNDFYSIQFINSGCMAKSMVDFLLCVEYSYPNPISTNNPYPGLLVVRDIIKANNKLHIDVFVDELNQTTEIILNIKTN